MCISVYILLPHKPVFKNSKIPLSINNQQKLSVLISVPQFTQSVCQILPYILCYLLVQKKSRGIASCTPNLHRCTSICLLFSSPHPLVTLTSEFFQWTLSEFLCWREYIISFSKTKYKAIHVLYHTK